MKTDLLTDKQRRFRKRLIQAAHCAPVYREIYSDDRDGYEKLLRDLFGKRSSTELTITELLDLVGYLNGRIKPATVRRRHTRQGNVSGMVTPAQKRKIHVLKNLINWRKDAGFEAFCEKRFGIKKILTDAQANMVIEGLKGVFEHQMAREHGEDWTGAIYKDPKINRYIATHRR